MRSLFKKIKSKFFGTSDNHVEFRKVCDPYCWPSLLETVTYYGNPQHEIQWKDCTKSTPPDENKELLMEKMKNDAEKKMSKEISEMMYE